MSQNRSLLWYETASLDAMLRRAGLSRSARPVGTLSSVGPLPSEGPERTANVTREFAQETPSKALGLPVPPPSLSLHTSLEERLTAGVRWFGEAFSLLGVFLTDKEGLVLTEWGENSEVFPPMSSFLVKSISDLFVEYGLEAGHLALHKVTLQIREGRYLHLVRLGESSAYVGFFGFSLLSEEMISVGRSLFERLLSQ
ncbi:MAG: hypothetical protein H6728_04865 [Myxococcales bacterium]|nr:hypothetical protein [Myxococcales bacterium]